MPLRVHHISVKLDKRFVVTLTIWEEWLFCCHIWTSASHLCKMRYVEPYFAYHVWSIQGRVSIDLHMLTTWICLQGLLLPPFILATSKAFGTWVKLNVTPSVTRHLTTKCDKRYTIVKVLWVKAKAKNSSTHLNIRITHFFSSGESRLGRSFALHFFFLWMKVHEDEQEPIEIQSCCGGWLKLAALFCIGLHHCWCPFHSWKSLHISKQPDKFGIHGWNSEKNLTSAHFSLQPHRQQ